MGHPSGPRVMVLSIGTDTVAVADPGFPRGGGANSPGGAPTYDFAKISQKLHEIERIWAPGGGGARPKFYYVDPPLSGSCCWNINDQQNFAKTLGFFLFCIGLIELIELGEFNYNHSSMTEGC